MPTVTRNNQPIFYTHQTGEADRPTLVLIHGAGGRHTDWPAKIRFLPKNSVYALDLPGHAKSARAGRNSIEAYAATRRIAHFHTSNEFGDWDTVLHTFTYANAIQHAKLRAPSDELLRGVFDAAMSVYLDRFLNIPSAPLPQVQPNDDTPADLFDVFLEMLNEQQQINQAGTLVAQYLANDGDPAGIIATLGTALLREDPDFHTIQAVETAIAQYYLLKGQPEADCSLIAAARYLAAHAPTPRAQNQAYQIA